MKRGPTEISTAVAAFSDRVISAFRRIYGYPPPSVVPWSEGALAFDGGTKREPRRYFRVLAKRDGTFAFQCRDNELWGVVVNAPQEGFTAAYETAVELGHHAHSKTRST